MRRRDPWENLAVVIAAAATIGAGIGAASALVFAERRTGEVERELGDLERRVSQLDGLPDRVRRLEAGGRPPGERT